MGRKKRHLWDLCSRMGFSSLVFVEAIYSKYMQETTAFRMKENLSLHSQGWKLFNDERDIGKEDKNTYT